MVVKWRRIHRPRKRHQTFLATLPKPRCNCWWIDRCFLLEYKKCFAVWTADCHLSSISSFRPHIGNVVYEQRLECIFGLIFFFVAVIGAAVLENAVVVVVVADDTVLASVSKHSVDVIAKVSAAELVAENFFADAAVVRIVDFFALLDRKALIPSPAAVLCCCCCSCVKVCRSWASLVMCPIPTVMYRMSH